MEQPQGDVSDYGSNYSHWIGFTVFHGHKWYESTITIIIMNTTIQGCTHVHTVTHIVTHTVTHTESTPSTQSIFTISLKIVNV
jgi:hypothetical protein